MNREDIIRMAQEAGIIHPEMVYQTLERFATLVASAERERLAKVFDERDKDIGWYDPGEPAEIIRARGQA